MIVLTAVGEKSSMYAAKLVSRVSIQGANPARYSRRIGARPGSTREREPAVADHLGGYALQDLALGARRVRKREV